MREKYETLAIKDLRAIAKIRGIKGASSMSKGQVIEMLVLLDETEAKARNVGAIEAGMAKETAETNAVNEELQAEKEKKPRSRGRKAKTEEDTPAAQTGALKETAGDSENLVENTSKNMTGDSEAPQASSAADAADDLKRPIRRKKIIISDESQKIEAEKSEESEMPQNETLTESVKTVSRRTDIGASDEAAKKAIEEAFVRAAALNPGVTPEEIKQQFLDKKAKEEEEKNQDSGIVVTGVLEIMQDSFGFMRCNNYLPGDDDVYVAPGMIRRFGLRNGDIITGTTKVKGTNDKFSALLTIQSVNELAPDELRKRASFETMTPIFPNNRISLETPGASVAMRVMDLLSPVGKGQRGLIVSPPKAGKTTLLKEVAKSVKRNNPEIHLIILLIDERPEEVTDIKEAILGPNVEVVSSTFDELPEHHKRVSEIVIERAKRLVEMHKDVMILLDSITRLTRAYNLCVPPSGRTLSGGLDPAALHMPKRFFGAARNMREGGSLTILATALVDTGSKMDDVVYEEFKGTGNMEMVLDRKLSEKRIFPAIDIAKSGTRRDDLLLSKEELDATNTLRRGINGLRPEESVDKILDMFSKTRGNTDFIHMVNKIHLF